MSEVARVILYVGGGTALIIVLMWLAACFRSRKHRPGGSAEGAARRRYKRDESGEQDRQGKQERGARR